MSTRRTGAHRHYRRGPEPAHRRGSAGREQAYVVGLRQVPPAPWWGERRQPEPIQPVEPDTMIIPRVITRVRQHVAERHPDRWLWTTFTAAIFCGFLISVPAVLQNGTLPDIPNGEYTRIVKIEGVSDGELQVGFRS